ncbi:MAG: hypothetical protein D6814_05815 [Calditrichaeota bacterium]|nr:MAG: hypothetical protein D6814_05815 [Calditrichota bacterium]
MLRIQELYQNELTQIIKIEGDIRPESTETWRNELDAIVLKSQQRTIILDLCGVAYIAQAAIDLLIEHLEHNIYLMNCPTFLKNILHSARLTQNILEDRSED